MSARRNCNRTAFVQVEIATVQLRRGPWWRRDCVRLPPTNRSIARSRAQRFEQHEGKRENKRDEGLSHAFEETLRLSCLVNRKRGNILRMLKRDIPSTTFRINEPGTHSCVSATTESLEPWRSFGDLNSDLVTFAVRIYSDAWQTDKKFPTVDLASFWETSCDDRSSILSLLSLPFSLFSPSCFFPRLLIFRSYGCPDSLKFPHNLLPLGITDYKSNLSAVFPCVWNVFVIISSYYYRILREHRRFPSACLRWKTEIKGNGRYYENLLMGI